MADVTSTTVATPAAPAAVSAPSTLGGQIDAEITILKSRIAAVEAAGKTDWAAAVAWVKANWAHFVTWAALAATSPLVQDVAKKLL